MVYHRRLLTGGIGLPVLLGVLLYPTSTFSFPRLRGINDVTTITVNQRQWYSRSQPFQNRNIKHRPSCITTTRPSFIRRMMVQPPAAHTKINVASLWLRGGGGSPFAVFLEPNHALSTMLEVAYPALAVSFTVWLVLAWTIQTTISQQRRRHLLRVCQQPVDLQNTIIKEIRQHRSEKLASLRQSLLPLLFTLSTACLFVTSFPGQQDTTLWQYGPSPIAMGLNFAYWASEIVMDTALDECGPLNLHLAAIFSALVQSILIVLLTTTNYVITATTTKWHVGHIVFWLKATETLLATALAKLIDHPYWIGIATSAIAFVLLMATTGRLAPLPIGVPVTGAVAYFVFTFLCSTAYQWVQNSPKTATIVMANIKFIRAALGCLSMCLFGTPPSWILYDAINFAIFFGLKVTTDTVALLALRTLKP